MKHISTLYSATVSVLLSQDEIRLSAAAAKFHSDFICKHAITPAGFLAAIVCRQYFQQTDPDPRVAAEPVEHRLSQADISLWLRIIARETEPVLVALYTDLQRLDALVTAAVTSQAQTVELKPADPSTRRFTLWLGDAVRPDNRAARAALTIYAREAYDLAPEAAQSAMAVLAATAHKVA